MSSRSGICTCSSSCLLFVEDVGKPALKLTRVQLFDALGGLSGILRLEGTVTEHVGWQFRFEPARKDEGFAGCARRGGNRRTESNKTGSSGAARIRTTAMAVGRLQALAMAVALGPALGAVEEATFLEQRIAVSAAVGIVAAGGMRSSLQAAGAGTGAGRTGVRVQQTPQIGHVLLIGMRSACIRLFGAFQLRTEIFGELVCGFQRCCCGRCTCGDAGRGRHISRDGNARRAQGLL